MYYFERKNDKMKPFFVKMQDFMQKNGIFFRFGCISVHFSPLSGLVEALTIDIKECIHSLILTKETMRKRM